MGNVIHPVVEKEDIRLDIYNVSLGSKRVLYVKFR